MDVVVAEKREERQSGLTEGNSAVFRETLGAPPQGPIYSRNVMEFLAIASP